MKARSVSACWMHRLRLGVHGRVGQFPAPLRRQRAGAHVVGKDLVDDLRRALVLEDPAVAAVRQQTQPGLDLKAVARQAAVTAQQRERADVAVPGAQARVGQLQLEFDGLAEQGLAVSNRR
jgi:hypothetical protein